MVKHVNDLRFCSVFVLTLFNELAYLTKVVNLP